MDAQTTRDLTMTKGQRDALLAAGIIRGWGGQWGTPGYVLAPGMTWDDVYAAIGSMGAFTVFYDAENAYYVEAASEDEAAAVAREEWGEGWQYIEPTERVDPEGG